MIDFDWNEKPMKKKYKDKTLDLRPEYDLANLLNEEAVNEALRLVIQLKRISRGEKRLSAKAH